MIILNSFLSCINAECIDILRIWIIVMLSTALLCFVVSEITKNYSQVDKLWSIMPIVYCFITAFMFPQNPRIWIASFLVAFWGFRLSYNFGRKGGYNIIPWKGAEDYRWEIMQNKAFLKKRWKFRLFNLFFISLYQHFLIMLISTPIIIVSQYNQLSLNFLDLLATILMIFFVITESISDNQQFEFHQFKYKKSKSDGKYSKSLEKGFLSEGLWAYVRHPNFTSEQAVWLSFYLFSVAASGEWFNWTIIGVLLLILIFAGSSTLTESISSKKYPDYELYKKAVPRFIPNPFKKRMF